MSGKCRSGFSRDILDFAAKVAPTKQAAMF